MQAHPHAFVYLYSTFLAQVQKLCVYWWSVTKPSPKQSKS